MASTSLACVHRFTWHSLSRCGPMTSQSLRQRLWRNCPGGTRRGANMGVLRVDHPDVENFISCKTNEAAITNFNISLAFTDAFMKAVEEDADWELRFPDIHEPAYKTFHGTISQAEKAGLPISYKKQSSRTLFEKFVKQAITTANLAHSSLMPPTVRIPSLISMN